MNKLVPCLIVLFLFGAPLHVSLQTREELRSYVAGGSDNYFFFIMRYKIKALNPNDKAKYDYYCTIYRK